jgi:hypothetical protein
MTVFSEKVIPTFTSSDHNIIIVESFNEIFFDVFELEINGNKYVAEKVSEKDGKPIVSIPLTHNGQKKNVPFLLEKGDKTEVYYNESSTRLIRPIKETKIEKIDILNLVETKIQEKVPLFEIPDVERAVDNIKAVKESAVEYLNKCRSEYVEAQKREIDSFESKKKQEIKKLNEEYRKNMVSEFLSLTENVKNQILESNSEERSDYNGYIRELFVEYCQEIEDRVDNNYETAINSLESKVNTLTETVFADKIQNIFENRVNEVEKIISANDTLTNKKLDKELSRINTRIDSRIDISSRENIKSIESLAERYDNALRTLEESVIDTNNNFIKSSNKALSRIGNVKNELSEKIDKVNLDINTLSEIQVSLRENIETHRGNIKKYFNKKISFLDTKITDVNEGYKKDIIDLIRESERKLLEEIAGIDTKLPTLILKEARTKKDNVEVSLEDIRKELENNISGRFSKEIVSLKRLIEMTSGGGGGGAGSGSQSLLFDENTAILSISNGNFVSLSALSGGGAGGGGITVETDPKFTTWAQANSAKYESTYTTVSSNSGNWNYQGSDIKALTANWQSTYTTVSGNSANWNSTYNTVYTTSGSWNYQGSDIKALTANWQSTYTTVSGNSANWQSAYTSFSPNSGNYNTAYLTILTGGTIGGPLTANGSTLIAGGLTVSGGPLSASLLSLSQTWNTAQALTSIVLNVTDIASPATSCLMDLRIGGDSRFRVCKTGTRIGTNASDLSTLEFEAGGTFTGNYNSFWFNQPLGNTGFQILAQGETPNAASCKIDGRNSSTMIFRSGNTIFQLGENNSTTQTTNQTLKAHNYTLSATGAGLVLAGGSGAVQSGLVTLSGRGVQVVSNSLSGTTLDLTQTWNTTQALTAIRLNVNDTASNASSMLMDLQVGGVSKFNVNKSGSVQVGAISANQDIEITDSTKGIILRSPNNTKYRVTVSDAGELITTQI